MNKNVGWKTTSKAKLSKIQTRFKKKRKMFIAIACSLSAQNSIMINNEWNISLQQEKCLNEHK